MNNKQFITTTLPYAAGPAHVGHLLEFVQADCLARYHRLQGKEVFFNTGLDEHGLKIYNKALELGLSPQEFCDTQHTLWLKFCQDFKISYDNFYRTSSRQHATKVELFWQQCLKDGLIYKKTYSGKYCVGCESFKAEKDLIVGKCVDHDVEPKIIEEENWFFRLTSFKETVLKWLDVKGSEFLHPKIKLEELKNIVLDSEDWSVSRTKESTKWGINVPYDDQQVIHVWFEALTNYVFSTPDIEAHWSSSIQLCGGDNLRFQAWNFQAILLALGLPHTHKLLVHGTILDKEGHKMSKSVGNVVNPYEQLEKYGLDAVRYYILGGSSTFNNSAWSETDLVQTCNATLANNYGNLLARTLHLIDTKSITLCSDNIDDIIVDKITEIEIKYHQAFEKLNLLEAAKCIEEALTIGNQYVNDKKPWSQEDASTTLNTLHVLLKVATNWLTPFTPDLTQKAHIALSSCKKAIIFERLT